MLLCLRPVISDAQVAASMYNINRNDAGKYDFEEKRRHNRPGKILLATGLLVGGLAIGTMAATQEYYIPNTMVYGAGGIMTLVATGLVLTSVNFLNKEIKIAYNGNSVGLSVCLGSINSPKRSL